MKLPGKKKKKPDLLSHVLKKDKDGSHLFFFDQLVFSCGLFIWTQSRWYKKLMNWFFLNADQNYSITSGWLDQKSGGFTKRFESLRTNSMHRLAGNTPWSTYVRNTSRVLGFWILFCLLLNLEHLVFNNALWKKKERKKEKHPQKKFHCYGTTV